MCGRALPAVARYLADRLVKSARNRLAELELEYGIAKSKVDSIRSKLFGALREFYQERDRLRLVIQFRRGSTRARAENVGLILEKKN
jgi:alcohol dehydrogenase class IV